VYIIGLTGGIASGKSTASRMLHELGACIIDADQIARYIVEPGQPAWHKLKETFGTEIILESGALNRKKLGEIVFGDTEARKTLNAITHERIKLEIDQALEKAEQDGYNIAVLDVPLLIEAGWQDMVDTVWVVYVEPRTQLARLMERDQLSEQEALSRISSQMDMDEKKKYADILIDNSGSIADTKQQIAGAWSGITKEAKTSL
jgi:dephospho-CoA kinase